VRLRFPADASNPMMYDVKRQPNPCAAGVAGDRVPLRVPGVASMPPIKVSEKDGVWNVEYADGVEQNFQSEAEAMVAAQEVADREGRVIERA
jgi:hypothetical protein